MLPILLTFAYLIGSFSSAIIVCKIFKLPDPRTQGSSNPGATNVFRMGNKKAAAITLIGDGLKGIISVLVARYFGLDLWAITLVVLAVFLGHVYPIFFGFKGGKGVATFLGALFALDYLVGLSFALTWLFIAKVLKISSLSALVATALTPIYCYLITQDARATYVVSLICIWIFYTHRRNIKKLLTGNEKTIH